MISNAEDGDQMRIVIPPKPSGWYRTYLAVERRPGDRPITNEWRHSRGPIEAKHVRIIDTDLFHCAKYASMEHN